MLVAPMGERETQRDRETEKKGGGGGGLARERKNRRDLSLIFFISSLGPPLGLI